MYPPLSSCRCMCIKPVSLLFGFCYEACKIRIWQDYVQVQISYKFLIYAIPHRWWFQYMSGIFWNAENSSSIILKSFSTLLFIKRFPSRSTAATWRNFLCRSNTKNIFCSLDFLIFAVEGFVTAIVYVLDLCFTTTLFLMVSISLLFLPFSPSLHEVS